MAIDAGIYQLAGRGVKSVADYDQEAAQVKQNKLAEMMSGMKMDEYKRGVEEQNQLRNVYAQFGADSAKNTNALYQAGLGKQAGDYAKSQGEMAKTNAAALKDQLANAHSKISLRAQLLSTARDQASYDASRAEAQANGLDVSRIPAQFDPAFVASKMQESQTIKEQLEQKWKAMEYTTPNANSRLQADTSIATNKLTNEQSDKNNLRTVGQQKYATDSAATNSRLSREQSASQFDRREQGEADKLKAGGTGRTGPMSVTLQKELLESDDLVQSSKNIVNTLQAAKLKNNEAYSGYFAKGRAVLASNTPFAAPGADATIDIDNMMTGQGLEQMKSIFGAAPTEGERKILLDMQASVDKTPKQREAIMDRAIAAAQRREQYAKSKAVSIRDGSYLTQGAQPVSDAPAATQDAQAMEWARSNPNDPRSKAIMQRLGGK